MININNTNKAKWNASTESKTLTISFPDDNVTITNSDLLVESLTLEEAINEDEVLNFTGCIASRISFEVADIVQDLRGHLVTAEIKIGTQAAVPLFYGYVDTQDNLSHQDVVTKFEAYDPLVSRVNEVDVTEWYNALSFPRTVKSFRNAFFSYLGLSQRSITLPNDGLQMSGKTIDDKAITGGQILKYICQLNGVFGQFDRYGYFKYKELLPIERGLYPATDLYPATNLYPARESAQIDATAIYTALKYEPFEVDMIEKVNIVGSDGTIQGSYGSGDNAYTISDNPLAWAVNMTTAAENIFVQVSGLWFVPAEVAAIGLPYLECGDALFISAAKNTVRTYICSRTLSGIQAIADEFRCKSEKDYPVYKESAKTQRQRNADDIKQTNEDMEEGLDEAREYTDDSIADEAERSDAYADNAVYLEKIRTDSLVASSIEAEAIRTNSLVASSIQAEEVRTNTLVAQKIQAEETRTNTLVANSIQAEETRTNTLVANSIQAEATRTNTLIANSIQAEETRTNTLIAQKIQAEETRTNTLVANSIQAEETRTNNLLAEKASIQWVNGNFADFNYLNTNYLTAGSISATYATINNVSATYATIQSLEAVDGKFNNLNASKITSGTLSTSRLDVATLAASSLNSYTVNVHNLYASGGTIQATNGALIGSTCNVNKVVASGTTWSGTTTTINGYKVMVAD